MLRNIEKLGNTLNNIQRANRHLQRQTSLSHDEIFKDLIYKAH